jgi:NADP-dependent 3-hydroxy acid dehydrogenase YdfG
VIEANLTGPFLVCLEALDYMSDSQRAHVFNIASIAAKQGFAGGAAYCASKYGLRGFSDALRLDVAAQGIKVTTVYPPAVDTTIFEGTDVKIDKATMLKPERVADVIWNAYTSGSAPDDLDVTA